MGRPRKRNLIVELLSGRPYRLLDLAEVLDIRASSVRSHISRLRDDGFSIQTETTESSGDPRYRLLAGPGEPIP